MSAYICPEVTKFLYRMLESFGVIFVEFGLILSLQSQGGFAIKANPDRILG